jgi:glutathione S-transferase
MKIENRLITIPISHYCEKARWALEWSEIPFVEKKHLQGFHYLYSYKTAKSHTVPVLKTADGVFSDSTDIINWCDSKSAQKSKLRPTDAKLREEADQIENYFDEELGTAGRLWMYSYMLRETPLILKYSKLHDVPVYEPHLMAVLFPLLKRRIQNALKMTAQSREESKKTVDRVFDDVAKRLDGREFLVGSSFTSADLTFAALSAAALVPGNYGVPLPSLNELPLEMREQILIWRAHPAGEFALRIYRDFRRLDRA